MRRIIIMMVMAMTAIPMANAQQQEVSPASLKNEAEQFLERWNAAEFLLSDKASFITGTDLLVDGGIIAAIKTGAYKLTLS